MLNCSIGEILVVLCVACLVLKPEELPVLANKLGQWVAKAQLKFTELKGLFSQSHE